MTAPGCAVCGSEGQRLFQAHGYDVLGCTACGHRFASHAAKPDHVDRIYDDQYFFGGGAGYADYPSQAQLLRERGANYARLMASHARPGTLLDVGAAAGLSSRGSWPRVGVAVALSRTQRWSSSPARAWARS